jgi:NitT/TauT family transport system substrate-binding protein
MKLARTVHAGVAAVLTAALAAGCGSSAATKPSGSGLERTDVTITGDAKFIEYAALHIGIDQGLFAKRGLHVTLAPDKNAVTNLAGLKSGRFDVISPNYVSAVTAVQKGDVKMHLVADDYEAGPEVCRLLVRGDSPVHSVRDLVGKKVSYDSPGALPQLSEFELLSEYGVDRDKVQFVHVGMADAVAALNSNQVDAIWVIEPFGTQGQLKYGDRMIADGCAGSMSGFPIKGWFVTDDFAKQYPKTTAALGDAISEANKLADSDRSLVERTLTGYAGVDAKTASLIRLGTWPTTISVPRLQRVADLMLNAKALARPFDVSVFLKPAS